MVVVPRTGITAAEVQGLRVKLRALNDELQTAAERRNTIAGRLPGMDPAARPGYEARLKVLDERIISLERDLQTTSQQLAAAPATALTTAGWQDPDPNLIIDRIANDLVPIVAILSVFVFAPFTIAISRFFWKRAAAPPRPPAIDQATIQRLEQLQQSVDTIAIEVERISEGQRFVTRLMNERAVGAGGAEPVRVPQRAPVSSERG